MNSPTPATELQDAFRALALQLGGIIDLHALDDETAEALARAVNSTYYRAMRSVTGQVDTPTHQGPPVNPSIKNLIWIIDHAKTN